MNELSGEQFDEIVTAYTQDAKDRLIAYIKGERRIEGEDYLRHLQRKASGHCSNCETPSSIKSIEKIENGRRISFECGHGDIALNFKENVALKDAFRLATVGAVAENFGHLLQKVSARIGGFKSPKESEEKNVVMRLCKKAKSNLNHFENDVQDSATDIIASNGSEIECFQVTKLYEEQFWKKLMASGHVDFITKSILKLIEESVLRKSKYDKEETKKLILVIDTWPGIHHKYLEQIHNQGRSLFAESGYKEIWLVGETDEMIRQIF